MHLAHKLRVAKYAGEHFLTIVEAERELAKLDAQAAKAEQAKKAPGKEVTEKLMPKAGEKKVLWHDLCVQLDLPQYKESPIRQFWLQKLKASDS